MQPVLGYGQAENVTSIDWRQTCAAAAAAGVAQIELPVEAVPEIGGAVEADGVRVGVVRCSASLVSLITDTRLRAVEVVGSVLQAAANHGVPVVAVRPAPHRLDTAPADRVRYADALHALLQSLRRLTGPAARCGVCVAIEVAADGLLLSPIEVRQLLDEVNTGDIRACLDLSRMSAFSLAADWVDALRYRIGCVRWRATDPIDLGELWAELHAVRYPGPVVCAGPLSAATEQLRRFAAAGGDPA